MKHNKSACMDAFTTHESFFWGKPSYYDVTCVTEIRKKNLENCNCHFKLKTILLSILGNLTDKVYRKELS